MRKLLLTSAIAALLMPLPAAAQTATSTKNVAIVGTAPAMCFGGTLNGDGTFDLGVLIDTATGLLRTDLSAPPKVLVGSLCTGRSTITINATPLAAQSYTATPPSGFARAVNYTATASGWTTTPASFDTASATNPAATQSRTTAFTGDIAVSLSNFATSGGSGLRLVADDTYRGLVTVTIAAVN